MNKIEKKVRTEIGTIKYLSEKDFNSVLSIKVKNGDKIHNIEIMGNSGEELAKYCKEWAINKYAELLKKEKETLLNSYLNIQIPTVDNDEDKAKIIEHLKNQLSILTENETLGNNG